MEVRNNRKPSADSIRVNITYFLIELLANLGSKDSYDASNYNTTIPPAEQTSPYPNGGDSGNMWHLVNIIGLAAFLVVVVGPIGYVTFCCKRPLSSQFSRTKCKICCMRLFTCFWVRRHHGCREDIEVAEETHDDEASIEETEMTSAWEPPTYEQALTFPRIEDTIQGVPPPMYKDLLLQAHCKKIKHEIITGQANMGYSKEDYNDEPAFCIVPETFVEESTNEHISHSRFPDKENHGSVCKPSMSHSHSSSDIETHRSILRSRSIGQYHDPSMISSASMCSIISMWKNDHLPTYEEALEMLKKQSLL